MLFQTIVSAVWVLFILVNLPTSFGEMIVQPESTSPPVKFNEPSSLANKENLPADLSLEKDILDPKLVDFEEKLKKMGKKVLVEPGSYSIINEFNEAEAAELGTFVSSGADSDDGWVVTILGVCCILAALSFFICSLHRMLENEKDDDDETVEDEQELEYEDEIEDEEGFDDEELLEEEEVVIETAEEVEAY